MDTDRGGDRSGRFVRGADPTEHGPDEVTRRVIGCAIAVSNARGAGFLEKVYENALAHELRKQGTFVEQQVPLTVTCDGVVVGEFVADLLVSHAVLVELKAVRSLEPIHEAQVLNYLKATSLHTGLLLNFGTPRVGIKRLVL